MESLLEIIAKYNLAIIECEMSSYDFYDYDSTVTNVREHDCLTELAIVASCETV